MVRALYAKMIEREHGDLTNSSLVAGSPPSFFTSTSTPEYGDMGGLNKWSCQASSLQTCRQLVTHC